MYQWPHWSLHYFGLPKGSKSSSIVLLSEGLLLQEGLLLGKRMLLLAVSLLDGERLLLLLRRVGLLLAKGLVLLLLLLRVRLLLLLLLLRERVLREPDKAAGDGSGRHGSVRGLHSVHWCHPVGLEGIGRSCLCRDSRRSKWITESSKVSCTSSNRLLCRHLASTHCSRDTVSASTGMT